MIQICLNVTMYSTRTKKKKLNILNVSKPTTKVVV